MTGTGRRRRRAGGVALAVMVVLVVGAAAVAAAGFGLPSGEGEGQAYSELPPATGKVTRQTLVDVRSEDGELGYGDAATVSGRVAGTVTALPAVGSTVLRGQALYHVDDAAVVLLFGPLPAYRALSSGLEGADVRQFEENLRGLGYGGFTVDGVYSASTTTAVKKWQKDLGLPQTGVVELGRVFYAAGPVRVDSQQASVGETVAPGAAVLACTGTSRLVTVELDVSDQRLAVKGAAVSVTSPGGAPVAGKVAEAKTVVKPAEGQSAATTVIQVAVAVDDENALAGLDPASVTVGFTASRREDVLTVPVAALLALAEGGYGVQVVDGASTRIVAVRTGLFAAGRVEVSGEGLADGMTVGMPA